MSDLQLYAIGQISADLGVPQSKVRYYIQSRHIEPIAKVGQAWCYDRAAVEKLRRILGRVQSDPRDQNV